MEPLIQIFLFIKIGFEWERTWCLEDPRCIKAQIFSHPHTQSDDNNQLFSILYFPDHNYCWPVWIQDTRWRRRCRRVPPHCPEVWPWLCQSGWNNALTEIGACFWTRNLEKAKKVIVRWYWREILHAQQRNIENTKKICFTIRKYSH